MVKQGERAPMTRCAAAAFALSALFLAACGGGPETPYEPVEISAEDRARAERILEERWTPLPENWVWRAHPLADGSGALRWGYGGNLQADETILFIPGFTGVIEYYTEFAERWAADGYRVAMVDMPGQGGSVRGSRNYEKPWSNDFDDYGDVMARFIDATAEAFPGKLTVIGESMGGAVLANAAARHDTAADRIVLHVPGLDINFGATPRWVGIVLAHSVAGLGGADAYVNGGADWSLDWYDAVEDTGCLVPPERINIGYALTALNPEWRVGDATFGLVAGMLASGGRLKRAEPPAIPQPVALITADNDLLVRNERAVELCEAGTLGDCRHIEIASGHCLAFENKPSQEEFYAAVERAIRG